MDTAVRHYIDNSEFFKNSAETTRAMVADICRPRHVSKKENLFMEGQEGNALYLCGTASVQLYKTNPEGKPIVVRVVNSGEIFAEVILFEQNRYPVNAEIIKSGVIYSIDKRDFNGLLADEKFRSCFFGDLMRKQRYLADKVRQIVSYDVEQRFFFFLREHHGAVGTMKINLTKKNIADAIGTSPETFSRMLQRFKIDGTLTWEGDAIILKDGFWDDWYLE